MAIQRLPLPAALLRLVSPHTAEAYAFSLQGTPSSGSWHPLSLDGPATSRELAKAVSYALLFVVARAVAGQRRRKRTLIAALGLAGFTVAAIGFGHRLFDASALFGSISYRYVVPTFLTTFGNRNNTAGLLCLTAPILLTVGLRGSRRGWLLWGPAYTLTSVAVFLTLSRGGMSAFLASQLTLGSSSSGAALRPLPIDRPAAASRPSPWWGQRSP